MATQVISQGTNNEQTMNDKILTENDILCDIESVDLIQCDSCDKETIMPRLLVPGQNEWIFNPFIPWECSHCHAEAYFPQVQHGCRFGCPTCKKLNVQGIEPDHIERDGCIIAKCYHRREVMCIYCETTFGIALFTHNSLTDPRQWRVVLFNLERK